MYSPYSSSYLEIVLMQYLVCVLYCIALFFPCRLAEFEATSSSGLTVEEFQNIDLEEEADPPCFTESRKKAKLQQVKTM